ncbi:hypothetical protein Taro_020639, partial [Colocasia esculenta]|nr:hypothetical protein [Colocasia esculenta]
VQTFFCKRCVDTPINGVDTTTQIQRQNFLRNQSTQVDTLSEQVDTRPSSQNSQFEELGQQVDTLSEQVDTRPSSQNSQFEELGQHVDTLSKQVDTGPSSQNISSHIWDSVSTPPPWQVDTLWKVCNIKWMAATCQPRPMGYQPRIKPLKHPKEADPVEAFVGEEFKEDPTIPKCRASELVNNEENLNNNSPSSSGSGNIAPEVGTSQQCTAAPLLGIRSTRRPLSHLFRQEIFTISLKLSSFFPSPLLSSISSPNSTLSCTMVRKLGPRRGARSRASSRPIPADRDVALSERRTKRRNDSAEQLGSSSAPQRAAKRGRASSSGRGSSPPNPRTEIPGDSSENPEESSSSSSESSASQEDIPSESVSASKLILKPRILDLSDIQLADFFPEIQTYFSFQSWIPFISEFQVCYPRLVREFYKNLTCTEEGYESKVQGIAIDMPTEKAASIFNVPDEGADYHEFEFDLHEAYSILTGLPADASDPK